MDDESQRRAARVTMLINRVQKNVRHLRKWARRDQVTCYRIYDRDIPELPLAIDWYDGRLCAAVYARDGEDDSWLAETVHAVADALGVDSTSRHIKQRTRQRGVAQYEKLASQAERIVVTEGPLKLLVNLSDYLDTGLFLDHRVTRRLVREACSGLRVLNLFSYTGSFSVAAAVGGARDTTSVDLSQTYLSWAEDNLRLNGFGSPQHCTVRADVREFLKDAGGPYDLVVVDPPTFSNSKKLALDSDLNRDHGRLLRQVLAVVRPGGTVWFSTNSRKLKLDTEALVGTRVEDMTRQTIPEDFRNRRIHRCWRITRG